MKTPVISCFFASVGIVLGLTAAATAPQAAGGYSLDFVAEISFPSSQSGCGNTDVTGGSDIWGYTAPDGTEYAIMGVMEGIAVVRVPDMTVIDVVEGPMESSCYWHRDIKTYGHYAYAVSEMVGTNQGIMILDLSDLPNSVGLVGAYNPPGHSTSHNLSIDEATGYAYVCSTGGGGFRIVNLADPENPVDVHEVNTGSIHDLYATNDLVYVAEGWLSSFSVYDCSNKTNPVRLAEFQTPGGYAHSFWADQDGQYAMTTEETPERTCKVWNVSDASQGNISLVGEWLGASQIAHNAHILGDFAFVSHYSSGVSVVDISDPSQPIEIANYDTYPPHDEPAFEGCWGVYPYTENDMVFTSDMHGDLTVFQFEQPTTGAEAGTPPGSADLGIAPNPFRAETMLSYQLLEGAPVRIDIFDVHGARVRGLVDGHSAAGNHVVGWDGRRDDGQPVAGGAYFYRLQVEGSVHYNVTKKVVKLD